MPFDIAMTIADLRQVYDKHSLLESQAQANPFAQFEQWFAQAHQEGGLEANAMTVATVDEQGRPASRICLLKGLEDGAFVFFTNYASAKGQALAHNQHISLLFFWHVQQRQVHIQGQALPLPPEASDAYFSSRPLASQWGAWASPQSQVISREALDQRYAQVQAQYGEHVPRPPHWGGYRVLPQRIEFWQGRPSRLHDRLLYTLQADGSWSLSRLAP